MDGEGDALTPPCGNGSAARSMLWRLCISGLGFVLSVLRRRFITVVLQGGDIKI
jgi:hypothetical protein